MNDEIKKDVYKVQPLKKICMTIGELPTSYLETMTYYEMLVWFTNYLRDNIIPAVNNNAEAVRELQILFTELQNYVNDYFDNLDVQEEINNKLDDYLENGTLEQIIGEYIQNLIGAEFIFPKFIPNAIGGDCNLIKYDNKVILIDTHHYNYWSYIKDFLDDNEVSHIDYLVISHYHDDHDGNFQNLITNGYVDSTTNLYMPAEVTTFNFETKIAQYKQICEDNDLNYYVPYEGQVVQIGELSLTFTNCNAGAMDSYYTIKNQNSVSMIVLVSFRDIKALFTADATNATLGRIKSLNFIKGQIDLYKVPHHGLDTNSVTNYQYFQPKYSVQSSGINYEVRGEGSWSDVYYLNKMGSVIYSQTQQTDYIKFITYGTSIINLSGKSKGNSEPYYDSTLYVDINASKNNIQTGTQTNPFSELMQCISYIATLPYGRYTINLADGDYGYSLTTASMSSLANYIMITIPHRLILSGNSNDNTAVTLNGMLIRNANVRLENLTIDIDNHDNGIYTMDSTLILSNVRVTSKSSTANVHSGFYLQSSLVSLRNTFIDYCSTAINVNNGSDVTMVNTNYGSNNTNFLSNDKGIVVEKGTSFVSRAKLLTHDKQFGQYTQPIIIYKGEAEYSLTQLQGAQGIGLYDEIKVDFMLTGSFPCSTGILYDPEARYISLFGTKTNGTTMYEYNTTIQVVSGGLIKYLYSFNRETNLSTGVSTYNNDRNISVTRITGYKYDSVVDITPVE